MPFVVGVGSGYVVGLGRAMGVVGRGESIWGRRGLRRVVMRRVDGGRRGVMMSGRRRGSSVGGDDCGGIGWIRRSEGVRVGSSTR